MPTRCAGRRALAAWVAKSSPIILAAWAASAPAGWQPIAAASAQGGGPVVYGYRVVTAHPHDSRAYTQGLIYRDGFLFESTGLNGRSTVRKVRLDTGAVVQEHRLDGRHFGEGLTDWGSQLIQLTWQSNVGFVYDLASFKPVRTFKYSGEGWGLTHDGKRLIMSDGQPGGELRYLDPTSLRETGRLAVRDSGRPVANLNELEYVRGEIFANVYQTDRICRIDPATGRVLGWIDLTGLLSPSERQGTDVLNGIAYDARGDRLFVTGKLWPRLFEISIERR
jgi:glutaminyl-peptide cyclotransferase